MTSSTSAASLGLGGLARQSGQAQQAERPSRSEVPPRDGKCHLYRLSVNLILRIANDFLELPALLQARSVSRHYKVRLAATEAVKAYMAQLPLLSGAHRGYLIGQCAFLERSGDFYSASAYDRVKGEIYLVRSSNRSGYHCVDVCSVANGQTQRTMHLSSDSAFDCDFLALGGGYFLASALQSTGIEICSRSTGELIHHITLKSGRISQLIADSSASSLMVVCSDTMFPQPSSVSLFNIPKDPSKDKPPIQGAKITLNGNRYRPGSLNCDFHRKYVFGIDGENLHIWNYESGKTVCVVPNIRPLYRYDETEGMIFAQIGLIPEQRLVQIDATSGKTVKKFSIPAPGLLDVCEIHHSSSSKRIVALLVTQRYDTMLAVWDRATGERLTYFSPSLTSLDIRQFGNSPQIYYEPRTRLIYCRLKEALGIYNFHGKQLLWLGCKFPCVVSDKIENKSMGFELDLRLQKLLIFHASYVIRSINVDRWLRSTYGVETVYDFTPLEQPLQVSRGEEPRAKRARIENKDSKDEKKS